MRLESENLLRAILAGSHIRRRVSVPLYEYKCTKCGRRTEKIESISGPHLKKCPHCGAKVESLISAPAIQFKGSGWYVTDYAGKKSDSGDGGGPKDEKSASDKRDATSKDSTKESSTKETTPKEAKDKKFEKSASKK
jgi:putative FmdB family regulatory protein